MQKHKSGWIQETEAGDNSAGAVVAVQGCHQTDVRELWPALLQDLLHGGSEAALDPQLPDPAGEVWVGLEGRSQCSSLSL